MSLRQGAGSRRSRADTGVKRIVIASDVRLVSAQGVFWSTHPSLSVETLDRYLALDLPVVLLARLAEEGAVPVHALEHPLLSIRLMGSDSKSGSLPSRAIAMTGMARGLGIGRDDLVVLRIPEVVSVFAGLRAITVGSTVVSNVVAEPEAITSNLPRTYAWAGAFYRAVVRWIVGRSRATVYVTKRTLQRRVPPPPGRPTLVASNVRLSPDDFVVRTGHFGPWDASRPLRIVSVGSMESPVKGFDLLIRATSDLRASGVFVTADLVGSGRLEPELKELSQTCGVADHVTFHGHIGDRAELFRIVDGSDVFVLPSRSEGLPRAMIEAMARGACVAGSAIGGIVELADPSCLFPPEQLESMVDCLQRLYLDPTRVAQLAEEGQRRAAEVMAEAEPARVTALLRVLAGPPATSRTGAGPRAIPGAGA